MNIKSDSEAEQENVKEGGKAGEEGEGRIKAGEGKGKIKTGEGKVSWHNNFCMTGITLCFKVE